ncbi:hypothetical protein FA95DRAFT_1536012 [Auriscalpium vulgare]|uniref:Uncharacterized protein n=1 Tax=Auriscalpium vulgare TaxID=40419 RepID=A0ACB8S275_9AGAM|nr:hypothetical protein FA95DRAFT_1536012 [Auriscalpium vulgare]
MEFRLLVDCDEGSAGPVLSLDGRRQMRLTEPLDILSPNATVPDYTCVSYVWGPESERLQNAIHPSVLMSTHTLPALRAATRAVGGGGFWMDAFSVPLKHPAKRATLESMGFIYSKARRVVVVLAAASMAAFAEMATWHSGTPGLPPRALLDVLNADMWVRSVWTYQEVVNSRQLFFTSDEGDPKMVDGSSFLNGFGYFMEIYKKRHSLTSFDIREGWPYLDAFDDLIADYMTASYGERSAYQILASMQRRVWNEDANYFYSMIGAITTEPSRRTSHPTNETLAEAFMIACEEKGDYSFVFTANERDPRPGEGWRPMREVLKSVLPWHTYGDGQLGVRDSRGVITLKGMALLDRAATSVSDAGRDVLVRIFQVSDVDTTIDAVHTAARLALALKQIGFTGSDTPIVSSAGLFFPQNPLPLDNATVWVSTSLVWSFGAPGLAVVKDGGTKVYVPGVFVGDKLSPDVGVDLMLDERRLHL